MMQATVETPYPALNAVLIDLVTSAQAILRDNFVGAYLQGSLAIGDFDADSDVDFLIVIKEEITEPQLSALQAMHERIGAAGYRDYGPDCRNRRQPEKIAHWQRSLEGSYFPGALLKHHDRVGGQHWYIDNGSITLERSDHDDTLVVRWTMRERGITLCGPEPKSLIDPIPAGALRDEVRGTLRRIAEGVHDKSEPFWNSQFGQPFAVLTVCRILQTISTGTIESKRTSALWGQENLDREWAGLIQRAMDERGMVHVAQPADPECFERTLEFIGYGCRLAGIADR